MTYAELVAELIRIRKAKGWTRTKLALHMQTSESHVYRLETMAVVGARETVLLRWCAALGYRPLYTLESVR